MPLSDADALCVILTALTLVITASAATLTAVVRSATTRIENSIIEAGQTIATALRSTK